MEKVNVMKLKNRYNGDVVFCDNIKEIREESGVKFVLVYNSTNPNRKYLVNLDAFEVVNKR